MFPSSPTRAAAPGHRAFRSRPAGPFGLVLVLVAALLSACAVPLKTGGQVDFEAGRYDRAAEVFESEVALNPANAGAWLWLGRSYAELDSVDRAAQAFDRAVELDAGLRGETVRQRSSYADRLARRGEAQLTEAVALDAASPERPLRFDQAAQALKRARRLDPETPSLELALYRLSRARGDSAQAAEHLREVTRLAETGRLPAAEVATFYSQAGHEAVGRKDYHEAITQFATAARLNPDDAQALSDLAVAHLLEVETDGSAARDPATAYAEALRLLENVRRLKPADPDVLYNLATIRFRLGDFRAAEPLLRGYLAQRPEDPDAWQLANEVLVKNEQTGEAQTADLAAQLLAANHPAAAPAEWARSAAARYGMASDLGRLYSERGSPDRVDSRQKSGRSTEVWFYFKAGRVAAFKDGTLAGEPIQLER